MLIGAHRYDHDPEHRLGEIQGGILAPLTLAVLCYLSLNPLKLWVWIVALVWCAGIGLLLHRCARNKTNVHIMIVGLEKSGKTTLVQVMRRQCFRHLPTHEDQVELERERACRAPQVHVMQIADARCKLYDLSGTDGQWRSVWYEYGDESLSVSLNGYDPEIHAIVFVVDAAAPTQLTLAGQELAKVRAHRAFSRLPIAVLFNKMDQPSAATVQELYAQLGFDPFEREHKIADGSNEFDNGQIRLFCTSAASNNNCLPPFTWLVQQATRQ